MIGSEIMRKIVLTFSTAWVVFSLATTGYEVLQPKWRERLKLNPYTVQADAGSIYNRGAVAIAKQKNRPEKAILFVDHEKGLLYGLPLAYWLSPTYLVPLYNQPLTKDLAAINSVESLRKTLQAPEGDFIYYIGSQQTLEDNTETLKDYTQTLVRAEEALVFMTLERNL